MVSETWDGKRVYFTSSLLSHWDKKGKDGEQFLKAFAWDGAKLSPLFAVDFTKEGLGRGFRTRNSAFVEGWTARSKDRNRSQCPITAANSLSAFSR